MKKTHYLPFCLLLAITIAGCGSSRPTVPGYDEAAFKSRKIAVLMPAPDEFLFKDEAAFAHTRGVSVVSAREQIFNELKAWLPPGMNQTVVGNTFFTYQNDPVSKIVPLRVADDIGPSAETRKWPKIKQAATEGKFDYLLAINRFEVINEFGHELGMGDETISCDYSLLDPAQNRMMIGGNVKFTVREPRTPKMSCDRLAVEMLKRLPFPTKE